MLGLIKLLTFTATIVIVLNQKVNADHCESGRKTRCHGTQFKLRVGTGINRNELLIVKPNGNVISDDKNDDEEDALENNGKMIYFSPCDDKGSAMLNNLGERFEVCVCHKMNDVCHKKRLVKLKNFDELNATEFNHFDYEIHESVEVKITDHAASFLSNQAPMRYVEIVLRGNGEASSYTLHEERTGTNHNEQRTGTNHNEL